MDTRKPASRYSVTVDGISSDHVVEVEDGIADALTAARFEVERSAFRPVPGGFRVTVRVRTYEQPSAVKRVVEDYSQRTATVRKLKSAEA